MIFSLSVVAFADTESSKNMEINSASDLIKLSAMCRLDTTSENMVVNLNKDITVNSSFEPIAIFSGTFNGNGHTITGLDIKGKYSYSGLFAILTDTAVVKNLTVQGTVVPSGETEAVGGIAGTSSGTIESCCFYGTVKGLNCAGGIVGENKGTINGCTNYGEVNVGYKDGKLTISDIKQLKLTEIPGIMTLKAAENVGGIAGSNDGTIYSSNNYGSVGTKSNGYKVGGIVGYNTGYITLCTNSASISGKSKVGGIVGQTVPFIKTEYSKDYLSPVADNMTDILNVLDNITYDIDDDTDILNASISNITNIISRASGHANTLTTNIYYFGNDTISEVNEIMNFATTATSGLQTVTGDVADVGTGVKGGIYGIQQFVAAVKEGGISSIPSNLQYIDSSLKNLSSAVTSAATATEDVNKMISAMNAVSPEGFSTMSPEIKESLTGLTSDLNSLSKEIKTLSNNLSGAEKSLTSDIRGITGDVKSLMNAVTDIVYSLQDLSISSIIKDTSGNQVSSTDKKYGIIENCLNTGSVTAKDNAGGIAGTMDFTTSISISNEETAEAYTIKTLSYRSIISYSRNYGYVTSTNNYCGSICGHENTGAIVNCQGYGSIKSEKGEYVGGIAGGAAGLVRDCFAKTVLSGEDYVAGIIGDGSAKNILGVASTVSGCVADATVVSDTQHKGGISGTDNGTYALNYFLVGDLNGMETYSREFEAAPVSQQTLLAMDNCPKEFSWSEQQILSAATTDKASLKDALTAAGIAIPSAAAIATGVGLSLKKTKKKEDGDETDSQTDNSVQEWKQ